MKRNSRAKLAPLLVEIGAKLGELRMKQGYDTISGFANEFGLPPIHYWRIEKGKANLTIKTLLKLLAIHKMTVEDFFCIMGQYS